MLGMVQSGSNKQTRGASGLSHALSSRTVIRDLHTLYIAPIAFSYPFDISVISTSAGTCSLIHTFRVNNVYVVINAKNER